MADSMKSRLLYALSASLVLLAGCGGGGGGGGTVTPPPQAATPTITTSTVNTQNGAEVVTLATTTPAAAIYYTTDGTTPTTSSPVYQAPFLVASQLTVSAMAGAPGYYTNSSVATQSFTSNIASGTLVWSDEFANTTGASIQPSATVWTYDTGNNAGWGNGELENYCEYGSTESPCSTATPNAFVDTNGYLNIVAEQPSSGVYTSARLKTEGLFSFQYGRLEVRAQVPEAQGFWPAFWLMGNNIATVNWPACGEMDVLERVDAATTPDTNTGSIHGTGFTGANIGQAFRFPSGETAAGWHTYGMIWSKGSVAYYVDNSADPYVTFTPASISSFSGSAWPFDNGSSFIIMNLAVGGGYPGNPNSGTPFPSTMLVDYVRLYTN